MRSPPQSIAMVAYTHYPWDPRVRREAETLARMGREVHVVCARGANETPEDEVGGVRIHRVPLAIRRGHPLRYLFQYATFFLLAGIALNRLQRSGPAAVHVHSLPDFIAFVGLGARLRGAPLILDLHEAMPEIYAARFPRSIVGRWLAVAAERVSTLVATRVIVVNETIRDLLTSRGVPADRVLVVYNSPDLAAKPEGLADFPVAAEGRLRLVYAGTVDKERDLATLIRAVGSLRASRPAVLAIYGPGPAEYRAYLEGLVDGLGLRGVVHLGGVLPPDEVLPHLDLSDVGCVPYERNPITDVALPNKVFEHVLLGKPLVLPNLRGMRRAFEGAALFYEPGDPADLAQKITRAAAGGGDVDKMLERARVVYDAAKWDVQAKRLASAYAADAGE